MHTHVLLDSITLGILLGESYNVIHVLAKFVQDAKIPNKLSCAIVGEQFLYLSSYLVVLVYFPFLSFYHYPRYP